MTDAPQWIALPSRPHPEIRPQPGQAGKVSEGGVGFEVTYRHDSGMGLSRTGVITTPHGQIHTPAFVPVGTKANVKALVPEMVANLGGQAVLATAHHLYLANVASAHS